MSKVKNKLVMPSITLRNHEDMCGRIGVKFLFEIETGESVQSFKHLITSINPEYIALKRYIKKATYEALHSVEDASIIKMSVNLDYCFGVSEDIKNDLYNFFVNDDIIDITDTMVGMPLMPSMVKDKKPLEETRLKVIDKFSIGDIITLLNSPGLRSVTESIFDEKRTYTNKFKLYFDGDGNSPYLI